MSPGVPRDARFSQVSAGDPSFHCPPETYSEGPAWGKVVIGGLQSTEKGPERARTGAQAWWSHRIFHLSLR